MSKKIETPTAAPMTRENVRGYAEQLATTKGGESQAVDVLPGDDDASAMFLAGDEAKAVMAKALDTASGIAPRFMQLKPDQTLQGDYVGRGTMELNDVRTGEVKEVACYWFRRGKLVVKILGAHELDQALENLPADGTMTVTIYRGNDENLTGGKRVSRYVVAWKPSGAAPAPALTGGPSS